MKPQQNRAKEIFLNAVEISAPSERQAYLDSACAGDEALRREVEEFLEHHERLGSFLQPGGSAPAVTRDMPDVSEQPGTVIGPYKLLEQIGEGGFGVVFLAEQTEPVRRKVALKVLKPGMDTRQVIARFEAERQALAIMDHPNIAKVYDGGATPSGRPFFVMELVKGVPITEFCDQNHLIPRQRLELFVSVCHAVQHAHQKGIIHRDLKPSNVLLTMQEATPVVKVIDFGVAKALGQELTDKTLFTSFAQMIGTPLYMSPEQAGMSGLDIDTRSDIYSLGVLLYELLTGTTPFRKERFQQAAYDEIRRIIREEEPPKPSTRLSDSKDSLPAISAQRHTEPAKLTKLVRGELDWIVMKALEKDRNRRYETANGFAMDLHRYLADEPVQACPPSLGYRLRKFARRNRGKLAAAGVLALAVLVAVGGIGWAMRDREARQAESARERAARTAKLNQEVEAALVEANAARERALTLTDNPQRWEAALAAASSALKRAEGLAAQDDAALDPAVRERLQTVRTKLDGDGTDRRFVARFDEIRLEQTAIHPEVSEYKLEIAYPALKEAFRTYYGIDVGATSAEKVLAVICRRPSAIQEHILAALDYSLAHAPKGEDQARQWLIAVLETADLDPWRKQARQALAAQQWPTLEKLLQDPAAERQPLTLRSRLAVALPNESPTRLKLLRQIQHACPDDFWANHNLAVSLHYRQGPQWEEAIRYYTAALALRPRNPATCVNLGNALWSEGDLDGAITAYRDAVQAQPDYAAGYERLGAAFVQKGRLEEAVTYYRSAVQFAPKTGAYHSDLGRALSAQNKRDEAIACYRKAIACYRKAIELDPKSAYAHNSLGIALYDQKKLNEAIASYRKAIELDPKYALAHYNLGIALYDQKKLNEAIAEYRKAIELAPKYAWAHANLGAALRDKGELDEAIAACRKAIELDPKDASAHYNLGLVLHDQKKLNEAIASYRKAIELDPKYAWAHSNLGLALVDKGELNDAIAECRKAVELDPKNAPAHNNLGLALSKQGKLDEAMACFKKAIPLDPKNGLLHDNLGLALLAQGKQDEAMACFKKAIALDPKKGIFHNNLGCALEAKGKLDEAIACYKKAIELDPKNAKAHNNLNNLGEALARKGWDLVSCPDLKRRDPKRAVAACKEAVKLVPQSVFAWQYLGWVQYRAGNWKASIEALEKSCKLQKGGDGGQWIVMSLAHGKLATKKELPEKERARHQAESRRWYDQAVKSIDRWSLGADSWAQAIRAFRAEAAELLGVKEKQK
jgi:tetratricopeptide (TPR) repeat protein